MSRKTKKVTDSFWLSYSDLLTSLFFIMLVLFVICLVRMKISQGNLVGKIEYYEHILQLENQFKELSTSNSLSYNEDNKTFIAKDLIGIEIFKSDSAIIKNEYLNIVDRVGKDLEHLLNKLNDVNPDFSYLLVIEGYSANDGCKSMSMDRSYNYKLSFERALALYNRWRIHGKIDLRKYNAEILICGSGLNGINRDVKKEENNKRFVIQILPKIRRFEVDEIVYKVQIECMSTKINNPGLYYSDLENVNCYEKDGQYHYTSGSFDTEEEARIHCQKVKNKGYTDAFVISFKNGEWITN